MKFGWLLAGVVLAVAVPLNLVIITTIGRMANEAVEAQRSALLYNAQSIAASVDAELGKYAAIAQALAKSPALIDLDLAAFDAEARRLLTGLPGAWVLVSTVDGKPLLNLAAKAGETLPERRSSAGLMAQRIALESGQPYYSDVSLGRRINDWITWIEMPVSKDGKPHLAVSVFMTTSQFADLLGAQLRPKNWLSGIMDRQGRYIARAPDDQRLTGQQASAGWRKTAGKEGITEFSSREGDPIINANAPSKLSGWTIGVAVRKAEFDATAWSAARSALLLGGSLSILSLGLAALLARKIAVAMDDLRRDAPALIDGRPLDTPDAPPEIAAVRATLTQAGLKRRSAEDARRILNERQNLLLHVTTSMIEARDIRELGEIIFSAVADAHDVDVCIIYRRIPRQERLELVFQAGLPEQAAATTSVIEIGSTLCGAVAEASAPILADRARIENDPKAAVVKGLSVGAYCCHPLRARDGRVLGTLSFGSTTRSTFDATEFTFFQTLANFLAEAWERREAEQVTRMSDERQRLILDSVQAFVGVLDTDGTLIEANQPALVAGGLAREDVVGRKLWDCTWWSHDEAEVEKLKAAVSRAASGHIARFDTVLRMLGETRVAMDFVVTPVTTKDGSVRLLVPSGFDISDRKQAEERLRASEEQLRAIINTAQGGLWLIDPSGRTTLANPRMAEMLGTTPAALRDASMEDFCFPEDREEASDHLIQALAGETLEIELRFRRADGTAIPVLGAMTSLRAPDGTVIGVLGGFLDLTERKLNEERQRVLMRELVHRGKNLIAVVQSIARQTFRPDRPLDEAREAFGGRLKALANTHGSLTSEQSDTAMLHDIVDAELKTFGNRITVEGPQIELPSRAAQTFSLVLHELATNAAKHGALTVPGGTVSIIWRIAEDSPPRFVLEWRENGGPTPAQSTHKGFGTALITTIAGSDLGCVPKLDLDSAGLRYTIDAPLANVTNGHRR